MSTNAFFFDTADADYIRNTWKLLSPTTPPSMVRGITTNPNALHKVGVTTLESLSKKIVELGTLLGEIRGDGWGELHVQLPNCDEMTSIFDVQRWVWFVQTCAADLPCRVGIKIPPYVDSLQTVNDARRMVDMIKMQNEMGEVRWNVTGVSDAATALRCASHKFISYVSVIPGRMTEAGIDSEKHLYCIANRSPDSRTEIIAGSMRTVKGLREAIDYNTIPTIGTRVWDAMTEADYAQFPEWFNPTHFPKRSYVDSIPVTGDANIKLTKDFFIQMNDLGWEMYAEWRMVNP